jgi:hypothetical protein
MNRNKLLVQLSTRHTSLHFHCTRFNKGFCSCSFEKEKKGHSLLGRELGAVCDPFILLIEHPATFLWVSLKDNVYTTNPHTVEELTYHIRTQIPTIPEEETLTEVFPCIFLSCKANARVKLAKTGHGPHSSTLVCICVARLLFVLFYVLFVCKCLLPPGVNATAVNKYIISRNPESKQLIRICTECNRSGRQHFRPLLQPCKFLLVLVKVIITAYHLIPSFT